MKFFLTILLLTSLTGFSQTILFQENFDNLPDWMTLDAGNVGSYPSPFDYGYTEEKWHPSTVNTSLASMYISGDDVNQVFGGVGKAFVATYESWHSTGIWTSGGSLTKNIPPSDEIYIRFKVKFQPGFNIEDANGSIKLFRIMSWDGVEPRSKFFSDGNTAPIYLFGWAKSNYGVRHKYSFRCDDQATTYFCTSPVITNAPQSINNGDMSTNFTSHIANLSPQLPDLVNGGNLPSSGIVSHAQVYGDIWHTMEFYIKLNSNPSANDGILRFWLNGEPLIDMNEIAWIGNNGSMNAKWNSVAFGGNGKYHYDSSVGFNPSKERWVAFDDILILDGLPSQLNINEYQKNINLIIVYPTPSSTHFTLKSTLSEVATVTVYNNLGQKITTFKDVSLLNGFTIDVNNWAAGIYYCSVTALNQYIGTVKIIVSK